MGFKDLTNSYMHWKFHINPHTSPLNMRINIVWGVYFLSHQLAQCRTENANPAANITWFKNKTPLLSDGSGRVKYGESCSSPKHLPSFIHPHFIPNLCETN